ncbi:hypothetical protein HED60_23065 [Planctomycetales bacterium ZRK34]|nr:hypothetical protein HED60_23065 [Planctomycetales bacterium ZRK34]
MDTLIYFDDGLRLGPLCDLRPSFDLRTGALTTYERLTGQIGRGPDAMIVPTELAALTSESHNLPVNALPDATSYLMINGRLTRISFDLPAGINTALTDQTGSVIAARLDRRETEQLLRSGGRQLGDVAVRAVSDAPMLRKPWDVLEHADVNLEHDIQSLAERMTPLETEPSPRVTIVGDHPVLIGKNVTIHPHVVFDTTDGAICVDDHAEIRSMGVMVGPGYVGPHSVITNHAHIRGHMIIGPWCKVGGEVFQSVFQGYANKAHAGYLGNSYVGQWVNFGADTVTSNLKNTYGPVRMQVEPEGQPEETGRMYLGSIIGDHAKTAIATRLLTGTCVHTGAMIAVGGLPPKCVGPFTFLTDHGAACYDLDKFCEVAATVMGRRNVTLSPAMRQRLLELHAALA